MPYARMDKRLDETLKKSKTNRIESCTFLWNRRENGEKIAVPTFSRRCRCCCYCCFFRSFNSLFYLYLKLVSVSIVFHWFEIEIKPTTTETIKQLINIINSPLNRNIIPELGLIFIVVVVAHNYLWKTIDNDNLASIDVD